jgi:hypothetical protein
MERGLRLHTEPKYKLYDWAINEVDAQGQQIGAYQIPGAGTIIRLIAGAGKVLFATTGHHRGPSERPRSYRWTWQPDLRIRLAAQSSFRRRRVTGLTGPSPLYSWLVSPMVPSAARRCGAMPLTSRDQAHLLSW